MAGIPEGHAAAAEAASKMKDWQSEFAELDKGSQELTQDCDHFGLPAPVFPALDHLREDMTQTASAWELYNEFSASLSTVKKEDWISFRGKQRARFNLLNEFFK